MRKQAAPSQTQSTPTSGMSGGTSSIGIMPRTGGMGPGLGAPRTPALSATAPATPAVRPTTSITTPPTGTNAAQQRLQQQQPQMPFGFDYRSPQGFSQLASMFRPVTEAVINAGGLPALMSLYGMVSDNSDYRQTMTQDPGYVGQSRLLDMPTSPAQSQQGDFAPSGEHRASARFPLPVPARDGLQMPRLEKRAFGSAVELPPGPISFVAPPGSGFSLNMDNVEQPLTLPPQFGPGLAPMAHYVPTPQFQLPALHTTKQAFAWNSPAGFGLAGAGIGAGLGLGSTMLSDKKKRNPLMSTLTGAALGGGLGALGHVGYTALNTPQNQISGPPQNAPPGNHATARATALGQVAANGVPRNFHPSADLFTGQPVHTWQQWTNRNPRTALFGGLGVQLGVPAAMHAGARVFPQVASRIGPRLASATGLPLTFGLDALDLAGWHPLSPQGRFGQGLMQPQEALLRGEHLAEQSTGHRLLHALSPLSTTYQGAMVGNATQENLANAANSQAATRRIEQAGGNLSTTPATETEAADALQAIHQIQQSGGASHLLTNPEVAGHMTTLYQHGMDFDARARLRLDAAIAAAQQQGDAATVQRLTDTRRRLEPSAYHNLSNNVYAGRLANPFTAAFWRGEGWHAPWNRAPD